MHRGTGADPTGEIDLAELLELPLHIWECERERDTFRRSVNECLRDPGIRRLLGARPGVSRGAVRRAMWRPANVHRALTPTGRSLDAFRTALRRLDVVRERRGRAGSVAAATWRLLSVVCSLAFLAASLGAGRAGTALVCALWAFASVALAVRTARSGQDLTDRLVIVFGVFYVPLLIVRADRLEQSWYEDLRAHGTGPLLERVVEALLGEDSDALLTADHHDGLRASHGPGFLVPGGAADQLRRRMDQIDGGTIAVCGPRGVGKTTLLKGCTENAGFSVFVSAPATYAPHDFLLSLFITLCRRHIEDEGFEAPEFVRLSAVRRTLRVIRPHAGRALRRLAFALPAAALVVLGLFPTVRSLVERPGSPLRRSYEAAAEFVGDWVPRVWRGEELGAALAVTAAGILLWRARRHAGARRHLKDLGTALVAMSALALLLGPFVSLAFDPQVRGHTASALSDWRWTLAVALLLAGCVQVYDNAAITGPVRVWRWELPRARVYGPLRLALPATVALLVLRSEEMRAALTDGGNPARLAALVTGLLLARLIEWRPRPAEPPLVRECRDQLYRLRTVQSSSAGVTSSGTQLLTLGTSHTTSLSTVPPKFPELVADFRELLVRIAAERHARGQSVVIAIDEVDRLGSDAKALEFLGEIKAILGIAHVHYLISVAEDVGAAFVRRGLPYRDVTDSSLDDIVHVQPGTLADSAAILEMRAPGISGPYVLLAHALSGGLPRDLIRYGRRIVEVERATSSLELRDISRAMILEELSETLAGFRTLLGKQQWNPDNAVVLVSFRTLAGRLRAACSCSAQASELQWALEDFALRTPYTPTGPGAPELTDAARQLIAEASVYSYFSLTLLDVFGARGLRRRRESAAANGPYGDPEMLAEARRELAVSPYSARPLLTAIREAWGLPLVAVPAPLNPAGPCPLHGPGRAPAGRP
ncbi:hypothetical protein ACGFZK_13785 [Streptomyces sp. NPDC048257]|uniref:hypothetical protein n=1 Tax=Streptomyces sp. NPDC048257 TaxID=3365526 RepID=UPI003719BE5D